MTMWLSEKKRARLLHMAACGHSDGAIAGALNLDMVTVEHERREAGVVGRTLDQRQRLMRHRQAIAAA